MADVRNGAWLFLSVHDSELDFSDRVQRRNRAARAILNSIHRSSTVTVSGSLRCTFCRSRQAFHPAISRRLFRVHVSARVNDPDTTRFFRPAFRGKSVTSQQRDRPRKNSSAQPSLSISDRRLERFRIFRFRPRLGRLQCLHHRPDHRYDQDQGSARPRGAQRVPGVRKGDRCRTSAATQHPRVPSRSVGARG